MWLFEVVEILCEIFFLEELGFLSCVRVCVCVAFTYSFNQGSANALLEAFTDS